MTESLWELADVTLEGHNHPRLQNLSLTIKQGVTVVIGFSGAGKTSLLSILAGLTRPDKGQLRTPNRGDSESNRPEYSMPLFWVPQDCGLWPHCSVRDHIELVQAEADGNTGKTDKLLADFDLSSRQDAFPSELSHGEQSRVAVARCLASNAAVLIMDEPLSHIDPVRRPEYWEIIQQHVETAGPSLVFSTHEPEAALMLSENVICLENGKDVYSGATADLYHSPPDEKSGRFLGPLNSIPVEFTQSNLADDQAAEAILIRPEYVSLIPAAAGPLKVVRSKQTGLACHTILVHSDSELQGTLIHGATETPLAVGDHVRLSLCREVDR